MPKYVQTVAVNCFIMRQCTFRLDCLHWEHSVYKKFDCNKIYKAKITTLVYMKRFCNDILLLYKNNVMIEKRFYNVKFE